jgi:hypothetical protein
MEVPVEPDGPAGTGDSESTKVTPHSFLFNEQRLT